MNFISVDVEVQVHGDVGEERDERDRVVRGALEDGDNPTALAATSRRIGTKKRRQKMHSHVKQKAKEKKMCLSCKRKNASSCKQVDLTLDTNRF